MGLFRPRRTGRASRWMEWKVRLFVTGAVLGLAGMFLDQKALVWAALGVLAIGVGMRLLPEGGDDDVSSHGAGDDSPEEGGSAGG